VDAVAVSILRGLANVPWVDVAFLVDAAGHVLVSVGSSPVFSHTGDFDSAPTGLTTEPDTSLYMTAIVPGVYLGVLFEADVTIEDVRAEVTRVEPALARAIQG
jgi:hypothetical protein